ncbi:MAG: hypothetical protein M3Q60_21405 [Actinomycetota bacterium]|nr:hypothetical protein [Actinomycetota bacterium]
MTTIDEKLRKNRENLQRKLEEIRADADLTREAKARRMRGPYEEAKREESRLRQEKRDGLAQRTRAAERKAFAPPALSGSDPALVQMNYRAALDSVEGITDAGELSRKLERATITGDRTLARAVAWRANDFGADGVVRGYLDTDEGARAAWTEWADAHAEQEQAQRLGASFSSGVPSIEEPDELRGGQRA